MVGSNAPQRAVANGGLLLAGPQSRSAASRTPAWTGGKAPNAWSIAPTAGPRGAHRLSCH